ncbi:MAG: hypothetical protein CMJ90_12370 [Planctomycetes bacterium]|nr:hypothetical protein [Planctomycetota bacterium]
MGQLTRTLQGLLDELANVGTSLLLVLVIVDFMFPGSTGIVHNISLVLSSLSKEGQFSLVALLLFLLVHHRSRTNRSSAADSVAG